MREIRGKTIATAAAVVSSFLRCASVCRARSRFRPLAAAFWRAHDPRAATLAFRIIAATKKKAGVSPPWSSSKEREVARRASRVRVDAKRRPRRSQEGRAKSTAGRLRSGARRRSSSLTLRGCESRAVGACCWSLGLTARSSLTSHSSRSTRTSSSCCCRRATTASHTSRSS